MAGKRYSAGRVYLQVLPSFNGLQKAIGREVEKSGPEVEKAAEKVGAKAGERQAKAAAKAADKVERQTDREHARRIRKRMDGYEDIVMKTVNGTEVRVVNRIRKSLDQQGKLFDAQRKDRERKEARDEAKLAAGRRRKAARRLADMRAQAAEEQRVNEQAVKEMAKLEKQARDEENAELRAQQRERQQKEDRDASRRAVLRRREAARRLAGIREAARLQGGEFGQSVRAASSGALAKIADRKVEVDDTEARRKLANIRAELKELSEAKIGVDIDAGEAETRIKVIRRELQRLDRKDVEVDVRVNAAGALAQLAALQGIGDRGNGIGNLFGVLKKDSEDGANSFRVFNVRVLAVVTLLPLLVPIIASVAGALGALTTAAVGAGAGLGVMILGFSGIGDAVSALGEVADNAQKDALASTKAIRNAAKGVRDAEQGLIRTRRNAARAAEDSARRIADAQRAAGDAVERALEAQENAEERLADAQRDATRAQDDLAESRRRAQQEQQDLADAIAAGQLDERQALIDLFNAQVEYNAAKESGASTNLEKEQLSINLARAQLAIKNIREENAGLATEQANTDKDGIEGSAAVVDAKQKEADAQRAIKDAQQDVADSQADVVRAQQDGARQIADAQRDAAEQAVDSADALRDAQERVSDAQAAYNEALTQTGEIGSASAQKLEEAFGKLGPAGRSFATFIFGLREGFYELRRVAQEGLLPGVQTSLETIINRYGPAFTDFVAKMSKAVGDAFVLFGQALVSPAMVQFFETMDQYAPTFFTLFAEIGISILKMVAGLMVAFAPFAEEFMVAFADMAAGWAEWAAGLKDNPAFEEFLTYVRRDGPLVLQMMKDIFTVLINIGKGMSDNGTFDVLTSFFSFLADLDPKVIAGIVQALLGLFVVSQVSAGITSLVISFRLLARTVSGVFTLALFALVAGFIYAYKESDTFREKVDQLVGFIRDHSKVFTILGLAIGGIVTATVLAYKTLVFFRGAMYANAVAARVLGSAMSLIFGPVGLVILAVVALIAGLVLLYKKNETFRNFVDAAWAKIRSAIVTAWEDFILPALKALGDFLVFLWENVISPTLGFIGAAFGVLADVITFTWETFVRPTFQAIGGVLKAVWENVVKPTFEAMGTVFSVVGSVLKFVFTKVIGPVFELLFAITKKLWNDYVKPFLEPIGPLFTWIGTKLKDVYDKYLKPYFEAFGEGIGIVGGIVESFVEAFGRGWDRLKSLAHAPIKFVIDTVINKGFVDNFNKLAEVFGTSKIPHLKVPALEGEKPKAAPASVNGQRVNRGQFDVGGWTGPGDKYQEAGIVHADEFVIKKESTNKVRRRHGLGVLDYINQTGELPGLGGYASGGLVGFGRKLQEMGFQVGEHPLFGGVAPVHTTNSWHYRNGAIDVNFDGQGQRVENSKINSILGLAKDFGLRTIWQYPGHFDHAHFDIGSGGDLGNFSGASATGGGGGDLPWYLDKPLDYIRSAVKKLTEKAPKNIIGDFMRGVPLKVVDLAAEKISELVNGSDAVMDDGNVPVGGGVARWRPQVLQALGLTGQPSSLAATTLRRMNQESGGNPRAINLTDINARNGIPSKGLMQVIDPTFAAYRDKNLSGDIYDPLANIVASMRYALGRYGSLSSAYDRPGGYADGGYVNNGAQLFDSGGYLQPGVTTVLNATRKPEPVFTGDQFASMAGASAARGPLVGSLEIPIHGTDLTAGDVADEFIYTLGRIDHGGKYSGWSD